MRITTWVSGSVSSRRRVASDPSISGIRRSIRTTSGRCSRASSTACSPSAAARDDLDVRHAAEQPGEAVAHDAMVVCEQDANHASGICRRTLVPSAGQPSLVRAARRCRGRGPRASADRSARRDRPAPGSIPRPSSCTSSVTTPSGGPDPHAHPLWPRRARARCAATPGRPGTGPPRRRAGGEGADRRRASTSRPAAASGREQIRHRRDQAFAVQPRGIDVDEQRPERPDAVSGLAGGLLERAGQLGIDRPWPRRWPSSACRTRRPGPARAHRADPGRCAGVRTRRPRSRAAARPLAPAGHAAACARATPRAGSGRARAGPSTAMVGKKKARNRRLPLAAIELKRW